MEKSSSHSQKDYLCRIDLESRRVEMDLHAAAFEIDVVR